MKPKLWHHILTGISAAVLLAATVLFFLRFKSMPDLVPTHFGPTGEVDGFGPKSTAILPIFLGWFMLGLMTLISFFPNAWNVPRKTPRALAAAANMIAIIKLIISLMIAWLTVCTCLGRGLGAAFLPLTLVGVFAPVVYLAVESFR